jgi:hypothetical protein
MVRRWEGVGLSTERYELLYARALGISPEDLASGPAVTGALSPLTELGSSKDGEDPVKRREFGFTAMGVLAGSLVPSQRVSVSPEHIRELRRASEELCDSDWRVGGSTVLPAAQRLYATARSLLDDGSYTSTIGTDLQAVTAELAANAGFIAFDAAQQGLARGLLTEAALLATGAADPLVTADTYSLLALQSVYLAASSESARTGLAREALRFLDQAVSAARHEPSPKIHAVIAMRRARAYGLLGDEREARLHLVAAQRELDRGDHPRDPHWTAWVKPSEITCAEAMTYATLGNGGRAAGLFREVLSDADLPARNRALYRASLASSLAAEGDSSQATAEGLRVLPALEGPVRSARTLNQLRPVRQQVARDSEFALRFDAMAPTP